MNKNIAGMIMDGVRQYRNYILYAIQNKDYITACTEIRGMASLLPHDANAHVPDLPSRFDGEPELKYHSRLRIWIDDYLILTERTIADYVYATHKKWENNM